MVERQLRARGISDERVLTAMAKVPRERFVPEAERKRSYHDRALGVGHGQTISQPWIVAAICQALGLEGQEVVLEVGTGTGYSAAILAELAQSVISIERVPELAEGAIAVLAEMGIENVEVIVGDGSIGLPERAPFSAIAVHAATPSVPATLIDQLADGGRLVAPVAEEHGDGEMLTVFLRDRHGVRARDLGPSRFVPLIGDEGFEA
jgi:protein-L-isoaspartate(D-aspartate) O-methyltransferase